MFKAELGALASRRKEKAEQAEKAKKKREDTQAAKAAASLAALAEGAAQDAVEGNMEKKDPPAQPDEDAVVSMHHNTAPNWLESCGVCCTTRGLCSDLSHIIVLLPYFCNSSPCRGCTEGCIVLHTIPCFFIGTSSN